MGAGYKKRVGSRVFVVVVVCSCSLLLNTRDTYLLSISVSISSSSCERQPTTTTPHNAHHKMQLSTLLGAIAVLATSAMASPLTTRAPAHNPTTADVTDFKAVRNGTHILYFPPTPQSQTTN